MHLFRLLEPLRRQSIFFVHRSMCSSTVDKKKTENYFIGVGLSKSPFKQWNGNPGRQQWSRCEITRALSMVYQLYNIVLRYRNHTHKYLRAHQKVSIDFLVYCATIFGYRKCAESFRERITIAAYQRELIRSTHNFLMLKDEYWYFSLKTTQTNKEEWRSHGSSLGLSDALMPSEQV